MSLVHFLSQIERENKKKTKTKFQQQLDYQMPRDFSFSLLSIFLPIRKETAFVRYLYRHTHTGYINVDEIRYGTMNKRENHSFNTSTKRYIDRLKTKWSIQTDKWKWYENVNENFIHSILNSNHTNDKYNDDIGLSSHFQFWKEKKWIFVTPNIIFPVYLQPNKQKSVETISVFFQ